MAIIPVFVPENVVQKDISIAPPAPHEERPAMDDSNQNFEAPIVQQDDTASKRKPQCY